MKLALRLLEKFISLPSSEVGEVRKLLDDLGLEVKDIAEDRRGPVFTIETLANRGDHLSALGVAREISARILSSIKTPASLSEFPSKKVSLSIRRQTDRCFRYALLEAEISPRLSLRSDVSIFLADPEALHPLVSMLNYVQSEIGQPMHAFDRDKLEGEIVIDQLEQAVEVIALDGKTYRVPAESIVIRDSKKIIAVAGVIGCANSMVSDTTRRVVIESALFCPICVRKTARKMDLVTDAAYAFERGVDVDGYLNGLKRIAHLLGSPASSVTDGANHLIGFSQAGEVIVPQPLVEVPLALVRTQLGMARLDEVQVVTRLKYLGYIVESISQQKGKEVLRVIVPNWRVWDVTSVSDVLEDLARSIGYGKIKPEVPALDYAVPAQDSDQRMMSVIEPQMIGHGFLEVISRVFYSAKEAQIVELCGGDTIPRHVTLKNSLESAYSHLKVTNIIHAAQIAEANHRRGVSSVKAFEVGQLFGHDRGSSEEYQHEVPTLTLWQSGRWMRGEWRQGEDREQRVALFRGVIDQLFQSLRIDISVVASEYPLLHPGCQGELRAGRRRYGFFGLIHPEIQNALDVKNDLLYAELDRDAMAAVFNEAKYQRQSEFPAIRRDITVRVGRKQFASDVIKSIQAFPEFSGEHSEILTDIEILDNFSKGEEDFRRVSYRLTFQSSSGTLEGQVIDRLMEGLFLYLESKGTGLI